MLQTRYHTLAIALHWVMALAIGAMLLMGLAMTNLTLDPMFTFQLYQWHKGLGVLILLATLLRIVVRVSFSPPPLPAHMPKWETRLASLGHLGLYVMMLALPLSGWLMVSASPYGLPTLVFGWFEWPHISAVAMNPVVYDVAKESHELLAFGLMGLLLGHVGAVVYHWRKQGEILLKRIWF